MGALFFGAVPSVVNDWELSRQPAATVVNDWKNKKN